MKTNDVIRITNDVVASMKNMTRGEMIEFMVSRPQIHKAIDYAIDCVYPDLFIISFDTKTYILTIEKK